MNGWEYFFNRVAWRKAARVYYYGAWQHFWLYPYICIENICMKPDMNSVWLKLRKLYAGVETFTCSRVNKKRWWENWNPFGPIWQTCKVSLLENSMLTGHFSSHFCWKKSSRNCSNRTQLLPDFFHARAQADKNLSFHLLSALIFYKKRIADSSCARKEAGILVAYRNVDRIII